MTRGLITTGETKRQGEITRAVNSHARKAPVEATLVRTAKIPASATIITVAINWIPHVVWNTRRDRRHCPRRYCLHQLRRRFMRSTVAGTR